MTDSCTCCKMAKFPACQTVKCKWTWNDKIRLYHISCTNKQLHLEGVGNFKIEKIWRYRGFWKWLRKEPSNLFFWMATIKETDPKMFGNCIYDGSLRLSPTTRLNGCLIASFPVSGSSTKCGRAQVRSLKFSTFGFGWGGKTLKWLLKVHETHPQHDSWNLLRLEIWLYSWGW